MTSVPFTSLWGRDAQTDAWPGYADEKAALLKALHSVPNVIILSGDRHEFAAIEFNGGENDNGILEFSTSPMSMFYVPFFRTLKKTSDATVPRVKTEVVATGDGEELVVTKYEIPQEKVLRYIASGNYKWSVMCMDIRVSLLTVSQHIIRSAFEVDTRDLEKPTLKLEVMIDGSAAYQYVSRSIICCPCSPLSPQPHHCRQTSEIIFIHSTWFFCSTKPQQNVPQGGFTTQ